MSNLEAGGKMVMTKTVAPVDRPNDYSHLFSFSGANKAGMQSIDKEQQAKVIYEMSKNSEYFKRNLKQDELTDQV